MGLGSETSASLKEKLKLGKVFKVEIGETRVIALLFFDFFVSLSNFRFESQSDVIPTEVYDQLLW